MSIKSFYFDLETGGLDPIKSPVLQFMAIVEVNGTEIDRINQYILPKSWEDAAPEALAVNKIDKIFAEHPSKFISEAEFYDLLITFLDRYINKFNTKDKFYMVGYNSHHFDAQFLRALFLRNENKFFGSYFWNPSVDVMLLAMAACYGQRHLLGDFKLITVAKSLGIEIIESRLHDAEYDVEITRELHKRLNRGLNIDEQ